MAENEKKSSEVETKSAKKAKPEKPKDEKKKGRVKNAWKGFKSEVKKVVWPTRKQVLKGTGVVLLVVGVCAIVLGGLDITFNLGMESFLDWVTGLFVK
jgi:preprotein translocase subunit SecE